MNRENKLKEYMKEQGRTVRWLADETGIGRQSVFNFSRFQYKYLKKDFVDKVLEALGADIDEVFPITRGD